MFEECIAGWWCNNHLEKYESMGRMTSHILIYILWDIIQMFETTNQIIDFSGFGKANVIVF